MTLTTIGDMRQFFQQTRHNSMIKSDLNTLVEELTTGQASDLTEHLGPTQTRLSSIDRQLQMLDRFAQSNVESGQLLSTMQLALGKVEDHRSTAASALLTINEASTEAQVSDAGSIARSGFDATVHSMNMRFNDGAMFGGTDVDANPLAPAADMMNEIVTAVTGLTTATDITAAIDDWFDTPGGGFETLGYLGGTDGNIQRPVEAGQSIEIALRADDPAIRETLKAFAKGAIAGDTTIPLTIDTRHSLQREAAEDMFTVAGSLASVQGQIGFAEGQVEDATVRIAAQQSSYGIARNNLVYVDPFETASRLEAVQLQLETHYTLTARLSRLSLTEYLR